VAHLALTGQLTVASKPKPTKLQPLEKGGITCDVLLFDGAHSSEE
jgi:hypothetical protein